MADTIRATMYADNTFSLYVNGELVAVVSIAFIPHTVISVDILPAYPMTIAVMAKHNANPQTGMEYSNANIGDAGFVLKLPRPDFRGLKDVVPEGPPKGGGRRPRGPPPPDRRPQR